MKLNVYDYKDLCGKEIFMDALVARICAFNIEEGSHYEVIKSFAIIARTELARKLKVYGGDGCNKHKGYHICTEPGHCLDYGLPNVEVPEIVGKAVKETDKLIITFGGKPIKPYFHYRCGGATENSENVIGNRITYIRKVLCEYCGDIEDEGKDKFFTLGELESLLGINIDRLKDEYYNIDGIFQDINIDNEGRIKTIKIGGKTFKGTEIMNILDLNSTRFNYMPVKFLISCIGKGHGLGLCFVGAEKMASQGKSYRDILNYYYTGIKLEEIKLIEEGKPLKGQTIVLDAASGLGDSNEGVAQGGLREGEVNLAIVLKLKEYLEEEGAKVFLTREDENHLILSDRLNLANTKQATLFISIGQNTFVNETASGTEVYYYKEDKAGKKYANLIHQEITKALDSRPRGTRVADYFLLREVRASSIIIELLYITNPEDEKKLLNPENHKRVAKAICKALSYV